MKTILIILLLCLPVSSWAQTQEGQSMTLEDRTGIFVVHGPFSSIWPDIEKIKWTTEQPKEDGIYWVVIEQLTDVSEHLVFKLSHSFRITQAELVFNGKLIRYLDDSGVYWPVSSKIIRWEKK